MERIAAGSRRTQSLSCLFGQTCWWANNSPELTVDSQMIPCTYQQPRLATTIEPTDWAHYKTSFRSTFTDMYFKKTFYLNQSIWLFWLSPIHFILQWVLHCDASNLASHQTRSIERLCLGARILRVAQWHDVERVFSATWSSHSGCAHCLEQTPPVQNRNADILGPLGVAQTRSRFSTRKVRLASHHRHFAASFWPNWCTFRSNGQVQTKNARPWFKARCHWTYYGQAIRENARMNCRRFDSLSGSRAPFVRFVVPWSPDASSWWLGRLNLVHGNP